MSKRIFISFDENDILEERASSFLEKLGRKKASYITKIVNEDLDKKGIKNTSKLTERDAKYMASVNSSIFCPSKEQ